MPNTTNIIKGKEVMDALSAFKEPVTMDEIVHYVAKTRAEPEEKVKKLVEDALNGGVRYGFIQKHNEFYYRVCDAVDELDESSEEDENDEVDSAESYESMDSGDIPPEPKPKKANDGKSNGGAHAQSRQSLKPKKVNKRDDRRNKKSRDIYSDEEENEDDFGNTFHKKSHKCNSDCYDLHRRSSLDDDEKSRARSRSASRRR